MIIGILISLIIIIFGMVVALYVGSAELKGKSVSISGSLTMDKSSTINSTKDSLSYTVANGSAHDFYISDSNKVAECVMGLTSASGNTILDVISPNNGNATLALTSSSSLYASISYIGSNLSYNSVGTSTSSSGVVTPYSAHIFNCSNPTSTTGGMSEMFFVTSYGTYVQTGNLQVVSGSIYASSGSVYAGSTLLSSDYRLKENVEPIPDEYTVDNLKPCVYNLIKNGEKHTGFIAHELQEVLPHLVMGEKDGEDMQSVNYMGLIAILTKEIQGLKSVIHEIKSENNILKNRIDELEKTKCSCN